MTILHFKNAVVRETCSYVRQRALVVKLHPRHLEIRAKGLRTAYPVGYDVLLDFAMKLDWKRRRAEKKRAKNT